MTTTPHIHALDRTWTREEVEALGAVWQTVAECRCADVRNMIATQNEEKTMTTADEEARGERDMHVVAMVQLEREWGAIIRGEAPIRTDAAHRAMVGGYASHARRVEDLDRWLADSEDDEPTECECGEELADDDEDGVCRRCAVECPECRGTGDGWPASCCGACHGTGEVRRG